MIEYVRLLLRKGTCMFWSICEQTVVHGAASQGIVLPKEINWIR